MTSCLKYDHWREHLTQKGQSKIMLQVINYPENCIQHVPVTMERAQLEGSCGGGCGGGVNKFS